MVVDDVAKKRRKIRTGWLTINLASICYIWQVCLAGNWKPGEIRLKLNRWLWKQRHRKSQKARHNNPLMCLCDYFNLTSRPIEVRSFRFWRCPLSKQLSIALTVQRQLRVDQFWIGPGDGFSICHQVANCSSSSLGRILCKAHCTRSFLDWRTTAHCAAGKNMSAYLHTAFRYFLSVPGRWLLLNPMSTKAYMMSHGYP
jgi:hypothetical protein